MEYRVIDGDNRVVGYFRPVDLLNQASKKKKVALVIGHDESKRGAYGNLGISEWKFNRELVYDELANGITNVEYQIFLRNPTTKGYTNQMIELHKEIDAWGANYAIEFHFNGSSNEDVNGHEILYYSANGKAMAEKLDKAFDKYLNNNDRNLKQINTAKENGYQFLYRGNSTCIIAEPFFGEHQDLYGKDGEMRMFLVQAYVEFINGLA
tara:strand:- start:9214 stop:9840 length:627 start_codon:yes stop_codon:yes gene_type:complete